MSDFVLRWVVTHLNADGVRTMCGPAQGRMTKATEDDARYLMEAMLKNNRIEANGRLAGVYGLPLEVRECRCWPDHFDPKQVWFDTGITPQKILGVAIMYAGRCWTLPSPNRHHHLIRRIAEEVGGLNGPHQEGFYADYGGFMNRRDAMVLAASNGQLNRRPGTQYYQGPELYSEDLW